MWSQPSPLIERELSAGERLLWSGQPRPGVWLRASDALIIPFSMLWCGFAIFWEAMALLGPGRHGGPIGLVFPLFGIPFVLFGLYFVAGRFFVEALIRRHTHYGITNERIILISGLFARRTQSLNLRTLSEMALSERPDGSGTITFGPPHPLGFWMPAGPWPGTHRFAPAMFERVDRAREVYDLIRKTQKNSP